MLIWRGRGGLIALVAFGCLVLTELFTRYTFIEKNYYQHHGLPKLVGFWVASGIVYAMRPWFGVGQERSLIDKATRQEMKISGESQLFFIPARYWPAILLLLGVVFFFVNTQS